MRVILWSVMYHPSVGGLENWARDLIRSLRLRGFEFMVFAEHDGIKRPDLTEVDGVPVHRFHWQRAIATHDLQEIKRIVQRMQDLHTEFAPDLLHINCLPCGFYYQLARFNLRTPTLMTSHYTGEQIQSLTGIGRNLLLASTAATAVSDYVLREILRAAPEIAGRATRIYNARPPLPASLALRPPANDPPAFLVSGRIVKEKGFDVALEAVARLTPAYPDARLMVAGTGLEANHLKAQANDLGLAKRVRFLGALPPEEMPALVQRSTAVLVPSRWEEPFGLVALEAMQGGRAVIASRVGGLPEIVVDEETGLLIPKEDPQALADAMARILTKPSLAAAWGEAGRQRAEEVFNYDHMVEEYDRIYRAVAGR